MTPDPCALFLKALYGDRDRITDIVHEKIVESPALALQRIPDGGMTNFNDNLDKVEYRMAKQAFKAYNDLDDTPENPLTTEGDMTALGCTGDSADFTTTVNTEDPNACHDSCLLDFGQGFKIYSSKLFRLAVTTPVVCAYDYIKMGKQHVEGYFSGMTESFTEYGMDNFEANLLNYVIQYGEANASVNSINTLNLTTGGFDAPPQYRLSVPFLRRYRQYMIREGGLTDVGLLDIETTRQDALDAINADLVAQGSAAGYQINIEAFEDVRGAYLTRSGIVYDGIRFIFNELPVRGYFKPTGTVDGNTVYQFVRVYHWENEVMDDGGLGWDANHQYDAGYVTCEGVQYQMCTLAFVINSKSFKRFGLGKPMRKHGENAGANYEMVVLDKSYIDCNDYNDKFRLAARHQFRFQTLKPELSGAIAYVHSVPCDYVIEPCTTPVTNPDPAPAYPQVFEDCSNDGCCPKAVEDVGELILEPCGAVNTVWNGEEFEVTLNVNRTGDGVGTAEATVTIANDASTTGALTANWADGDTTPKAVSFPIIDGDKGTADITATITVTDGEETLPTCQVTTVTVIDATA